jgi:hypothetical protein
MDRTNKIISEQRKRRKRRMKREKEFIGIEEFIKGDLHDKKKTATGHSHKMKTGGYN